MGASKRIEQVTSNLWSLICTMNPPMFGVPIGKKLEVKKVPSIAAQRANCQDNLKPGDNIVLFIISESWQY